MEELSGGLNQTLVGTIMHPHIDRNSYAPALGSQNSAEFVAQYDENDGAVRRSALTEKRNIPFDSSKKINIIRTTAPHCIGTAPPKNNKSSPSKAKERNTHKSLLNKTVIPNQSVSKSGYLDGHKPSKSAVSAVGATFSSFNEKRQK